MELYVELLSHYLAQADAQLVFPGLHLNAREIVEMQCYQALRKIKAILDDDSLADDSCFRQIEEIVCTFEELGSNGGSRHDFG